MCGIFGVISLGNPISFELEERVRAATLDLRHRGPDEGGVLRGRYFCFGHRRLSIIDLSAGKQPMSSSDPAGAIVYNGEVYNFPQLRLELEKGGYCFQTRSDTEVVLKSFLRWGEGCLDRLRGMFAFAAVDFGRERVLLARDIMGIKPLYYTERGGYLLFSSELEPLYRHFGPFSLNLEALDEYLAWQYIPAPLTIYEGVYCLLPAHYILVDFKGGCYRQSRYWELCFMEERGLRLEESLERLDDAIREAVEVRLVSDVPFGAFVSGGVDSSLVAGYMSEILERPVQTFSIGFREVGYNELPYAQTVARCIQAQHREEVLGPGALEILPVLVRHYGQPFADSSAIATYYVSRLARKYVKMVLSGDGGDEHFAGYLTYIYVLEVLGRRSSLRVGWMRRLYLWLIWFWSRLGLKDFYSVAYFLHSAMSHHFTYRDRCRLYLRRYRHLAKPVHSCRQNFLTKSRDLPLITRLQNLDIHHYLPYDILVKVDIASMANSLEVRLPLLDRKVIEFAARLPVEFKICFHREGWRGKYILKRLAERRYPFSLVHRPKMGFGVPLGEWFRGWAELEERLLGSPYLGRFFCSRQLKRLLRKHSLRRNLAHKIWNLLFLEQWMRDHPEAL
ncbi:MAG: asparagine synthase (glutamine-hydrolyzing) [Planctomycetota bacterium]|nr:MAG: asparagine synthase (glutamine-hydrolyzing) [Planctomycetota bacterium]